jgi:hypothetical protein
MSLKKYYLLPLVLIIMLTISCNSFKSDADAAKYAIGDWVGQEDIGGATIWDKLTFKVDGTFDRYTSNTSSNWSKPFSSGNWKVVSKKRPSDNKLVYLILLDWQSEYGHEYSAWPFVEGNKLRVVYNNEVERKNQVGPLLSKQ